MDGSQSNTYIHALFLSALLKYINLQTYLSALLDQRHNEWLMLQINKLYLKKRKAISENTTLKCL